VVDRHAHKLVEWRLASLGIAAFYPRLRRWVTHARNKVAAERPLLGQYLFVEGLARVDGLQVFLVSGGEPAVIADEVVWDWRHRYMLGEFDLTVRSMPVGALVRIAEGEFAEQLARVSAVANGKVTIVTRSLKVSTMRFRNVSAA
jgi:transcription antitermination factor NusG